MFEGGGKRAFLVCLICLSKVINDVTHAEVCEVRK